MSSLRSFNLDLTTTVNVGGIRAAVTDLPQSNFTTATLTNESLAQATRTTIEMTESDFDYYDQDMTYHHGHHHNHHHNHHDRQGSDQTDGRNSFELVMIALTFPLWTFITLYVLLMLIYYLRRLQYFSVYDKCTSRNAHFRYDFHLISGRHSTNYIRGESSVIVDLLDSQMVSTMTIQIPGSTVFNDRQMFVYRHARNNMRCVNFTVYRRHPIKDVKCIRVAHSCSSPDSRLFIYGVDVFDQTNNESKFFPISSVVKYRGTQWALMTTFEPKSDMNFKKMGLDCYDPFGYSVWPTHLESLTILLYIWCSSFCFGHLISIKSMSDSVPMHAVTVLFIVASSTAALSAIYLRIIKTHILDLHYDNSFWFLAQHFYLILVIVVSIGFWSLALNQAKQSRSESIQWLISTAACSLTLSLLTLFVWLACNLRRGSSDRVLMTETDTNLARTNSKEALLFALDPAPGLCTMLCGQSYQREPTRNSGRTTNAAPQVVNPTLPAIKKSKTSGSGEKKRKLQEVAAVGAIKTAATRVDDAETLDNAFGETKSKYMKNRNRNSIAQYV